MSDAPPLPPLPQAPMPPLPPGPGTPSGGGGSPRLWAALAIALFLVTGLMVTFAEAVSCPKVIQPLFEKLGSEKFQMLFKARIWVVSVSSLLFAAGLVCALGFTPKSRRGARWTLAGTVAVFVVVRLIATAVFIASSPKEAGQQRWHDADILLWLALVFTGSVALGTMFACFRGWLRWTGLVIATVLLVLMLVEWGSFVSQIGSKKSISEAARWLWWGLSVGMVLLKWGAALLPAVCVMFKPSIASES